MVLSRNCKKLPLSCDAPWTTPSLTVALFLHLCLCSFISSLTLSLTAPVCPLPPSCHQGILAMVASGPMLLIMVTIAQVTGPAHSSPPTCHSPLLGVSWPLEHTSALVSVSFSENFFSCALLLALPLWRQLLSL